MTERLNVRAVRRPRDSAAPPSFTPSQRFSRPDVSAMESRTESSSHSPLQDPRRSRQADYDGGDDEGTTYVQRIVALARKTVSTLFSSDGAEDGAGERRARPVANSRPPLTPQRMDDAPVPPAAPAAVSPSERYSHAGATADRTPQYPVEMTNAPAYIGGGGAAPQPAAPILNRTADQTIATSAPNVTVYQFFTTTTELQSAAPVPWYAPQSYGLAGGHPVRAVDLRPTVQYKRHRGHEEELRQLQAPPLQRRTRAPADPAIPSADAPHPAPAVASPRVEPPSAPAPKPFFTASPTPAPVSASKPSTFSAPAAPQTATAIPFIKLGPPAHIPADEAFAPGQHSSDEDEPKPASKSSPPAAPFGSSVKPAFSFAPAAATGGPSPFVFGGASAATAAPVGNPFLSAAQPLAPTAAKPPAPAPAAAPINSFFKPGPQAVIHDDDGFATDADDSDDDEDANTARPAEAPKPAFSLGLGSGGATPPPNPFGSSFKPLTGSVAAPAPAPPATGGFGGFFKLGPAAVIANDDGFAPGADDDDSNDNANGSSGGQKRTRTEDTAAKMPSFVFGQGGGAAPSNPFSFGSGGVNPFGGNASGSSPTSEFSFVAPPK